MCNLNLPFVRDINPPKTMSFFAVVLKIQQQNAYRGNTIRNTAKLVTWPFLLYLQFPLMLSHSFSLFTPCHSFCWSSYEVSLFLPPTLLSWTRTGREAKALPLPTSPRMPCSSGSGFSSCFSNGIQWNYRMFYQTYFLLILITCIRKRIRATCEFFFLVLTLKSEFWE